ncbi:Fructosamine/Ketosamine-3-kinase [Mycena floridula]|nr:Fructosamine/Ketosamine-3-kinase [Mycena floridula]
MPDIITPSILERLQRLEPNTEFSGYPPKITSSSGKCYFVKVGTPAETEQYLGEMESLNAIRLAAPGLAPLELNTGVIGDRPYMISEYKNLSRLTKASAAVLGKRVATELHGYKSLNGFGFQVPTYCGVTRLVNGWFSSWEECYASMIADLLAQLRAQGPQHRQLCNKGDIVIKDIIPKLLGALYPTNIGDAELNTDLAGSLDIQPVLLHGDLWSGNTGTDENGQPVIYDPASYYGHNEADLAIGRIFGGIPDSFLTAYHQHRPKSEPVEQYELRGELYELFHYLNHTLMFGGGYSSSSNKRMEILLSAGL